MPTTDYVVLARKYRPQTFAHIVGQEAVVRTLTNAIVGGRLHHAYLFSGSRGLGKTSTARILARSLNCAAGLTPNPCGTCPACVAILRGRGSEKLILHEIDGASNRSVDDARELRRTIGQRTGARYHVIVIDEVHMLTTEAFNTLLKTLEEPPPHVKFVFATTEPQKVPETILSRCQQFDFRRIPAAMIADYVAQIAGQEGIDIDREALLTLARISEGGMRDTLTKLDQAIAFVGSPIRVHDIEQIFGILSRRTILAHVKGMIAGEHAVAVDLARRIYEEGLDTAHALQDTLTVIRDVSLIKSCGRETDLVDVMPDERQALAEVARDVDTRRLLLGMESLLEGLRRLRSVGFPRLVVEAAFLKICEVFRTGESPARVYEATNPGPPSP